MSWGFNSVFYHIYPLGLCGCPVQNDYVSEPTDAITKIIEWTEHLKALEVDGLYLGPIFESDCHGYDTQDYCKIDRRLGSNQDFARVCAHLHNNGIRVVLDGVFNHVGRSFAPFADVRKNREASAYKDWFFVNFSGNSNYNDGFWYEGWEGHYELVKLNLKNPQVKKYLFECVEYWINEFKIDGLRLDVAYCLDRDFVRELCAFCRARCKDFFLLGEVVHLSENNKVLLDNDMLDSVTNYECYKGLFSSFNSANLFEIGYSINRLFGAEQWTLFKGKHLYNFADNHDVSRLASNLVNPKHISLLYALMYMMPGIPSLYYGSEWELVGDKKQGDNALRPCIQLEEMPGKTELMITLAKLGKIKKSIHAAWAGDYKCVVQTNKQYCFVRTVGEQRLYCMINADHKPFEFRWSDRFVAVDQMTGDSISFEGSINVDAYDFKIISNGVM